MLAQSGAYGVAVDVWVSMGWLLCRAASICSLDKQQGDRSGGLTSMMEHNMVMLACVNFSGELGKKRTLSYLFSLFSEEFQLPFPRVPLSVL
jgi:hypothetical protein